MLLLFYSFEKLLLPLKIFALTELVSYTIAGHSYCICENQNTLCSRLLLWVQSLVTWPNQGESEHFARTFTYWWHKSFLSSCSAQFSHSIMSDSLWPHGLQHTRLPCPSPTSRACSNSCPSQWCHPTISSSVIPFSSCLQSFPASGSFPTSQFFASVGQSIGASASASVLPMNTQDWSPLGWTGWISLQSKGLSTVFSNTTVQKHQFFSTQLFYSPTLTSIHDHWKNHSLD